MRDLKFYCSQCRQHIVCGIDAVGQEFACPTCGSLLTVPDLAVGLKPPSRRPGKVRLLAAALLAAVVLVVGGFVVSRHGTSSREQADHARATPPEAKQISGKTAEHERIKRGGKTWSAPAEYKISNARFQGGNAFLIWPADDPVVVMGRTEGTIRLKWQLGIGQKTPSKKPLRVQTRASGAFKDPAGNLLTKTELAVIELKDEGDSGTCDVSVRFESGIETAEVLIQIENNEFGKSNLILIPLRIESGKGKWFGRGQIRESQIVRESVALRVKGTKAHSVSFGGKKHWQFDTTVDLNRLEGASADDSAEPIWILYYYAPLGNPTDDEMRKLLYGLRPMGKPGTSMVESFSDKRKIRFEEHVFSLKPDSPEKAGWQERELYWAAVCPDEPSEQWTLTNSHEITFPIFGFSMKKLFGGDFGGSPSDGGTVVFAVCRFEDDGPILLSEPVVAQIGTAQNATPR